MSTPPSAVYAIATLDTKGDELQWVAERLRAAGVAVRVVDVAAQQSATVPADVTAAALARAAGRDLAGIQQLDRGAAVTAMGEVLTGFLQQETAAGRVAGVLGIGGSGGTALITAAMRCLPIGLPKLMVSTVASGQTAPYVDVSDICLMPSVVDVAGLNTVSRRVLANAAHAMAGMVQHVLPASEPRPTIGMTMFGVTTPCVTAVRRTLEARGFECLVFHATGTGGRAMEQLVASGMIQGVLDITTTEVADEIVGGVFPAGPRRLDVILEKRIPYVLSVGALDMVNFGAASTVPDRFAGRRLYVHNPQVTLMRTTADENRQAAEWIAGKLNRSVAPVTVLLPEEGISALDRIGQPFHDPQADAVLFDTLSTAVQWTSQRQLRRLPLHINDEAFAAALAEEFLRLYNAARTARCG